MWKYTLHALQSKCSLAIPYTNYVVFSRHTLRVYLYITQGWNYCIAGGSSTPNTLYIALPQQICHKHFMWQKREKWNADICQKWNIGSLAWATILLTTGPLDNQQLLHSFLYASYQTTCFFSFSFLCFSAMAKKNYSVCYVYSCSIVVDTQSLSNFVEEVFFIFAWVWDL